jgi:hypothetical protein
MPVRLHCCIPLAPSSSSQCSVLLTASLTLAGYGMGRIYRCRYHGERQPKQQAAPAFCQFQGSALEPLRQRLSLYFCSLP